MPPENHGDQPPVVNNVPDSTSGGAGLVEQEAVSSFAAAEAAYAKEQAPTAEKTAEEETAEADTGDATEETSEGEETPPVAETKPAGDGKLSKGQQKKADRAAAAARREGEERATKAEAEAQRLREENAALKAGKKAEPVAASTDEEPDPEKFEYGPLDPAYQKAVRAYDKAQIKRELLADQQADAAKAKASETTANYEKQVDALLEDHEDYYEVVEDGFKAGKWALPEGFSPILMDSPVGAKIAYELAKNPAESRRIAALPVLKQAAEFGKMEARLTDPPAQGKSGKKAAVSKADPPADTVRGQGGKFQANSATTDFAAFERSHAHLLNP